MAEAVDHVHTDDGGLVRMGDGLVKGKGWQVRLPFGQELQERLGSRKGNDMIYLWADYNPPKNL